MTSRFRERPPLHRPARIAIRAGPHLARIIMVETTLRLPRNPPPKVEIRDEIEWIPIPTTMLHSLGAAAVMRIRVIRERAWERRLVKMDTDEYRLRPEERVEVNALLDAVQHIFDHSVPYPRDNGPIEDLMRAFLQDPRFC